MKLKIINLEKATIESEKDLRKESVTSICVSDDGSQIAYFAGKRIMHSSMPDKTEKMVGVMQGRNRVKQLYFLNNDSLVYTHSNETRDPLVDTLEIMQIENSAILSSIKVRKDTPLYLIDNGSKILCNFGKSCPSEWPESKGSNENQ